jgi:hypothetical protein
MERIPKAKDKSQASERKNVLLLFIALSLSVIPK